MKTLILAVLLASGCDLRALVPVAPVERTPIAGSTCASDSDCGGAPYLCTEGRCRASCGDMGGGDMGCSFDGGAP